MLEALHPRLSRDLLRLGRRATSSANNRAFERHGIARVARTRAELRGALREALAERPATPHERFAALPSAASAVLATVRRRCPPEAPGRAGRRGSLVRAGPGAARAAAAARALGIARRLPPGDGVLLTFDDGPHPEGTPAVLEAARARARPIFFMVGEQVERYPALAAEVAAAGHEIALHGHRHRNQMRVTPRLARATTSRRGAAAIGEATGRAPALYRPPYGIFTPAGLALARRAGWDPLLWSTVGEGLARAHGRPAEIACARDARRERRRRDPAPRRRLVLAPPARTGGPPRRCRSCSTRSRAGRSTRRGRGRPRPDSRTDDGPAQPVDVAPHALDERRRRLPAELGGRARPRHLGAGEVAGAGLDVQDVDVAHQLADDGRDLLHGHGLVAHEVVDPVGGLGREPRGRRRRPGPRRRRSGGPASRRPRS